MANGNEDEFDLGTDTADEPELSEDEVLKMENEIAAERLRLEKEKDAARNALSANAAMTHLAATLPAMLPTAMRGRFQDQGAIPGLPQDPRMSPMFDMKSVTPPWPSPTDEPMGQMQDLPSYTPEPGAMPPRSIVPFQMPPVPPGFSPPWNQPHQYEPEPGQLPVTAPPQTVRDVVPDYEAGPTIANAARLPAPLPPPMLAAPSAPMVAPPTTGTTPMPQGKIYMGPTISPEAFAAMPQGTRIAPPLPAPLSPEAQTALQRRLALGTGGESNAAAFERLRMADRPGVRTIGVQSAGPSLTSADPMMQRFAMQEQVKRAVAGGMPFEQAFALYAPGMLGRGRGDYTGVRPLTEWQKWQMQNRKTPRPMTERDQAYIDSLKAKEKRAESANEKKEQLPTQSQVLAYKAAKATILRAQEKLDEVVKDSPEYKDVQDQIRQAKEFAKDYEGKFVNLKKGSAKSAGTSGRVRMINPEGKAGTLPEDQVEDAIAAGWKRA